MHHIPLAISDDLDLDVPRSIDEALDEDGAVTEGSFGFGRGRVEERYEILDAPHLMRGAIGGHQRSSEVIRGHQRSSEVIRGHSEAIRGHQEAIRGDQRSSEAI